MRKLAECIDCEKGGNFLIVGAGGTLKEHAGAIKSFIDQSNSSTIGINYMTEFCVPDYHLWTNR